MYAGAIGQTDLTGPWAGLNWTRTEIHWTKALYYMPSRDMPKLSPYFLDQIQLDGLKIPYYPSTVCNGKRQYLV